jgi:hypothetical protein
MAKKTKSVREPLSNNEIRRIMLQYFYDRNKNATSARGKKGAAVKISGVKKELKEVHSLTQQEVQSNLTYLISQGWVEEDKVEKSFTVPRGTMIPASTSFYKITAAGIDKIEGEGEFTTPKFHGIKIEATVRTLLHWATATRSTPNSMNWAQRWSSCATRSRDRRRLKLTR